MHEMLTEKIIMETQQAATLYHRLLLVVGPSGSGKTTALQKVAARANSSVVNVNLELSRQLLDFTERQRAIRVSDVLREIIQNSQGEVVFLDNIELLFDVSLHQDPLRLLQGISRNKTVVSTWNGTIDNGHLSYATPDHAEYKHYMIKDFLVVRSGDSNIDA